VPFFNAPDPVRRAQVARDAPPRATLKLREHTQVPPSVNSLGLGRANLTESGRLRRWMMRSLPNACANNYLTHHWEFGFCVVFLPC
jgi:hypothetical protein